MRPLAATLGALLIVLMLAEFFVTFLLPRRVRRDPFIARGFIRLLWRPWRSVAHRLEPASADTVLGFFGPLALIILLATWVVGLMIGFALLEWGVAGSSFGNRLLSSSGLFLSAASASGSTGVRVIALLEAATGVGVLFIVIGYLPAVYGSFSRREIAVSQLATRAGSPPAAGVILGGCASRERWPELERDLRNWEEWAAELMETHLSYPLLGFYRSQHVNQNWLAALTAMVDVSAFVSAIKGKGKSEAAEITFAIGRHALSDLAHQYRVRLRPADRLADDEFDEVYELIAAAMSAPVDREATRHRLADLRRAYEPQAQALADWLALELPAWLPAERGPDGSIRKPRIAIGRDGGDLVGQPARRRVRQRDAG
jgi:hypothetical protein